MIRSPEQCEDIAAIRVEIDRIDRDIIASLGARAAYVRAASRFKTGEHSVRAPDRVETMLRQRREWAQAEGLSPDVIEQMYRELVHYFTDEELHHWRDRARAAVEGRMMRDKDDEQDALV